MKLILGLLFLGLLLIAGCIQTDSSKDKTKQNDSKQVIPQESKRVNTPEDALKYAVAGFCCYKTDIGNNISFTAISYTAKTEQSGGGTVFLVTLYKPECIVGGYDHLSVDAITYEVNQDGNVKEKNKTRVYTEIIPDSSKTPEENAKRDKICLDLLR